MDCKCPARSKEKCEHKGVTEFCPLVAKLDDVNAKLERAKCMLKSIHEDGYNDCSPSGRLSRDERELIELIRLLEEE